MLEHIYPHLAEQEGLGVFRSFAEALDGFRIRPFEPRQATEASAGDEATMDKRDDDARPQMPNTEVARSPDEAPPG